MTKSRAKRKSEARPSENENDWIEEFTQGARELESAIGTVVREHPVPIFLAAAAAGVAAQVLFRNYAASTKGSGARTKAKAAPEFLSADLRATLSRAPSVFDRVFAGGPAGIRAGVEGLIADEMTARPWATIATAFSVGASLGGLRFDQLKRGAIRAAKVAAVRAIDVDPAGDSGERELPEPPAADRDEANPSGTLHH